MDINEIFYHQKLQLVTVDYQGNIINTDNSIFHLDDTKNIKEFHPIFETILTQICEEGSGAIAIPCLRIDNGIEKKYCDLRLKKETGYITILFFNLTTRYKEEHTNLSINNKSSIVENSKTNSNHISLL